MAAARFRPAPRALLWMALLMAAQACSGAAIRFEDFSSVGGLNLVGDASVSSKALLLTRARRDRSGAVWLREKQPVGAGFETTFQFQLTRQGGLGHGADGFAFVIQNAGPSALGGRGSAGGFAVEDPAYDKKQTAIPWSVAVFFDTYRNGDEHDPSGNYISFCTYGRPAEMLWPATRLAFTPRLRIRLKDRQVHTARILFQPPVLSVFIDGSPAPALRAVVDLSIVVDSQGSAWLGFTASTGGGYENHAILSWSFASADVSSSISVVSSVITFPTSACLPDRNLCTPERAVVEPNKHGYHVILPGNLQWGVNIPNRSERTVLITNAHGIVCWGPKPRGSDACSGPAGTRAFPAPGFLAADAPPGALIMRTRHEHTWFSVNGPPTFESNEGFYEFDLEVK